MTQNACWHCGRSWCRKIHRIQRAAHWADCAKFVQETALELGINSPCVVARAPDMWVRSWREIDTCNVWCVFLCVALCLFGWSGVCCFCHSTMCVAQMVWKNNKNKVANLFVWAEFQRFTCTRFVGRLIEYQVDSHCAWACSRNEQLVQREITAFLCRLVLRSRYITLTFGLCNLERNRLFIVAAMPLLFLNVQHSSGCENFYSNFNHKLHSHNAYIPAHLGLLLYSSVRLAFSLSLSVW